MNVKRGIWIITESEEETTDGGKGGTIRGYDPYDDPSDSDRQSEQIQGNRTSTRINAEELEANMSEFLGVIQQSFRQADRTESKMCLDEIELSIEINAEGKVGLLGNGTKAGAKGAITLKFKRKDG